MKHRVQTIARITLLAFLLNAILPFFAVYDTQASAKDTSLFGEKILICSGDGFKWVKWEDLRSGKEKHSPPTHYQCALCYVAAHGLKDLAMPSVITLASFTQADVTYTAYTHRPTVFLLHTSRHSRAPPSILL